MEGTPGDSGEDRRRSVGIGEGVTMPGPETILVCDDEELIRWSIGEYLRKMGFRVLEACDGFECLRLVKDEAPELLILDMKMPGLGGMEVLQHLKQEGADLPVVVITAHGGVETAIEATRLGARAYLSKPFDIREVGIAVQKVLEGFRLEGEVRYLRKRAVSGYGQIIGESPAMRRLFETLHRLERVDAPTVLLRGESGTGKDLIAQAIHESGPRRAGPYMEVDCASLPEALIESELFGHEQGAFTGARGAKRGLFEVARGGTIFLDEIGEMSPGTQAKLLRALENRRFKRVGGVADIVLNAGVIAATNRNLEEAVRGGQFREDLYFRLNVIRIEVPPLRDREQDVPLLVDHFLQKFSAKFGRRIRGVTEDALRRLMAYGWPGNVRELRNVLERIAILESDDIIREEHLPPEMQESAPQGPPVCAFTLPAEGVDLESVERTLIQQAMARVEGNQSAAARLLGITRYALRYRLEKHGLG